MWKDERHFTEGRYKPTIDGRRRGVREELEPVVWGCLCRSGTYFTKPEYPNGIPVECVVADTCIGNVAEAAACAEKFAREGVGLTLTVTRCWCYGSETMDMDPHMPKAVWGFNGTERPGAVYLAAVLAAHSQKGLPAFGIYGKDVQDANDNEIPDDVKEKIFNFVRAGLAVAYMKGKSYVSMGNVSMGIAGSIANPYFYQKYLGIRNEYIDMSEFIRRMNEGIYNKEEYKTALEWTRKNCKEGKDFNKVPHTSEQKDKEWEICVKMA